MRKVKIFSAYMEHFLENEVNDWLEEKKDVDIHDITFSITHGEETICYSVLIDYSVYGKEKNARTNRDF